MNELKKRSEGLRKLVFSHMLETRDQKYKWFLMGLRLFKYASMSLTKGSFLESYYTFMRYVDDVVDHDLELPVGYESTVEFVERKIEFANHATKPKDSLDYLMLYCYELAEKFNQDFSSETHDILSSMLFDAKRYGKKIVFSENELSCHYNLLDIKGTIRATLRVFGEDPLKYLDLQPLGLACRIYYNLRDFDEDINAGFVNISSKDCSRFLISSFDLENSLYVGIQEWFKEQSELGMKLLWEHKEIMKTEKFGLLTRVTLPLVYERPARRYFEDVISG